MTSTSCIQSLYRQTKYAIEPLTAPASYCHPCLADRPFGKVTLRLATAPQAMPDEGVKRRLQSRAASHGRSMEAEARAILTEAVREPADSPGLFTAVLDRFGALGGVDLDLPARTGPARAADFSQ
jgi:antitoxin FitA